VQGVSILAACYTQSWRQEQAGSRSPRPAKQVYISEWQLSRNQIRIEGGPHVRAMSVRRNHGSAPLSEEHLESRNTCCCRGVDCSVLLPWQDYQNIKALISFLECIHSPWKPCSLMWPCKPKSL